MLHPDQLPRVQKRTRLTASCAVLLVFVVALGACTGGGSAAPSTTSSTLFTVPEAEAIPVVTLPDGFVIPDTRSAILLPIEGKGEALPALQITGGTGSITGKVTGPDGPADGATVRIERVVGDRVASMTVTAGGGGGFSAKGLLGGAYRVRGWLQPSLATTEAAVTFLAADGGSASVTVTMGRFEGDQLQAAPDRADWKVGDEVTLRALLTRQTVNDNGVVVGEGLAASEVRIEVSEAVAAAGEPIKETNGSGIVTWTLTCLREGSHAVTVHSGALSTRVSLPGCQAPAATTTTSTPGDTLPPDLPPFPVGDEFTVPRAAAVPAGTYRTFLSGCAASYQVWKDGAWQVARVEAAGDTISLSSPARDFKAVGGTDGCRYRRVS